MPDGGSVGERSDFDLGAIRVRPATRTLETATASVSIEPLVMQLLVTLSRRAGKLVTRQQVFNACWGAAPVGDDSLNRAVAVLRKALVRVAGDAVQVETVAGAGYVLRLGTDESKGGRASLQTAIDAACDSWRLGLPEPDHLRLEQLRRATTERPDSDNAWGMLALLCRQAAEYAEPGEVTAYVAECESAARRALALNDRQGEALVALASVAPLFGRWQKARTALTEVLELHRDHLMALHDLAILDMATGRVRAAKAIMDRLVVRDPLAACFCYKSMYQHWSVGDLAGLDDVGDRAIQLWPTHPAIWMARFWTLAHTSRPEAALAMLNDDEARPSIPAPMFQLLRVVARAAVSRDAAEIGTAVRFICAAAASGPAQAAAALLALGLFDAVDESFEVAYAYYARAGEAPVPVRHTKGELSINDQHRRVTQPLFTPAGAGMRADARFPSLCERIGLIAYWEQGGITPDFLTAA